jgi:putative ABC transport system ATP-binding protein
VDPATERRISEALRRLSRGRTVITIAHRLSTAEHSDSVLVFDAGRVVERGTHAELVAMGGRYAELYRSWLGNTRVATTPDDAGSMAGGDGSDAPARAPEIH